MNAMRSHIMFISRPWHRPDPTPAQPGRTPFTAPQPDDVPGIPTDAPSDIPLREDPTDEPLE